MNDNAAVVTGVPLGNLEVSEQLEKVMETANPQPDRINKRGDYVITQFVVEKCGPTIIREVEYKVQESDCSDFGAYGFLPDRARCQVVERQILNLFCNIHLLCCVASTL